MDIFSRYVVGWMVASRESAALAEVLIRQTCAKQGIDRHQLTIHADPGSSMTSKPVAFLLADLGVAQSHSPPHVSNDNPFSEAQFKTLKYRPDFPGRFGSIEEARLHCQVFFAWYNDEHRHAALGLHTPADVHYGRAEAVRDKRAGVLAAAYAAHPERFVRKPPEPPKIPETSWINRPDQPVVDHQHRETQFLGRTAVFPPHANAVNRKKNQEQRSRQPYAVGDLRAPLFAQNQLIDTNSYMPFKLGSFGRLRLNLSQYVEFAIDVGAQIICRLTAHKVACQHLGTDESDCCDHSDNYFCTHFSGVPV